MTKKLRFSPVASQHGPAANRVAKLCLVGLLLGKPQASSNTRLYFCLDNVPGCERKSPFISLINKAPFPGNWILKLEGKIWHHICEPQPLPTSFGKKFKNKAWPSNKTMNSQRIETTSLDSHRLSSDFLRLFIPRCQSQVCINISWLWNRHPSLTQVLYKWYEVYKYSYQSRCCHT